MNNISDFLGSGKPKRITEYTSGTGTYVPTVDMARCFVRLQAGGGGGHSAASPNTSGGGGGAMIEFIIRIPIAGLAYAVGAGGIVAGDGSATTLGNFAAPPGRAATGAAPGLGGLLSFSSGSVDADSVTVLDGQGFSGVCGGAGGYSNNGLRPGYPVADSQYFTVGAASLMYAAGGNGQGAYSGGSSFYGKGGTNTNAPAADAYGAGGGGQAVGRGGKIEIWDFGA